MYPRYYFACHEGKTYVCRRNPHGTRLIFAAQVDAELFRSFKVEEINIPDGGWTHIIKSPAINFDDIDYTQHPYLLFHKKTGTLFLAIDPWGSGPYNILVCLETKAPTVYGNWSDHSIEKDEIELVPAGLEFEITQGNHVTDIKAALFDKVSR